MDVKSLLPPRRRDQEGAHSLLSLRTEMDRLFGEFFKDFNGGTMGGLETFSPRLNVTDTEEAVEVDVELPGMLEKDVEVYVTEDTLTIKGEKRDEREKKDDQMTYTERSYGAFMRDIPLPSEIDANKVKAHFDKGVLQVTLPKSEKAKKERKKIPVA